MDSCLQTGRLRLEPLTRAHAPAMFELLRDPAIYRHLDEAPPVSVEQLAARYARLEARRSPDGRQRWLNWVVSAREGAAPLGYVQATVEPEQQQAWVAYVFAPPHWGRGLAGEAVRAMLEHLAQVHGVQRCLATVEAANAPSIRLLGRLGFQPAGGDAAAAGLSPTERLFVRSPAGSTVA